MYTIILVTPLMVALAVFIARKVRASDIATLACFGGLIGAALAVPCALHIGSWVPMKDVTVAPARLATMRSADGVNGAFVWGSGSAGQQLVYHFYIRNSDGSLTPGKVVADSNVCIIEDATLGREGFWTTTWRIVDSSSALSRWALSADLRNSVVRQEFRVPVGTVVQSFKVN